MSHALMQEGDAADSVAGLFAQEACVVVASAKRVPMWSRRNRSILLAEVAERLTVVCPAAQVEAVLFHEFGAHSSDLFSFFEPEASAAASLAQVSGRAWLGARDEGGEAGGRGCAREGRSACGMRGLLEGGAEAGLPPPVWWHHACTSVMWNPIIELHNKHSVQTQTVCG